MDVAEQALQALEMLSRRHSKAILQAVSTNYTLNLHDCREDRNLIPWYIARKLGLMECFFLKTSISHEKYLDLAFAWGFEG